MGEPLRTKKDRVLEELPNGKIRYESFDGVEVGIQVGRYVVRERRYHDATITCSLCGARFPSVVVIDDLDAENPVCGLLSAETALLVADEMSRRGLSPKLSEWVRELFCSEHRGEEPKSFRQWLEGTSD